MNGRIFEDNHSFHMEKSDENTHTLTPEELAEKLEKATALANEGANEFRKNYIKNVLEHNGIDFNTVDIDSILNGNIPEWFNNLDFNISNNKEKKLNIKYFKLSNGTVVKIDIDNLTGYILNNETKSWIENASIFADFEYGNIHGDEIEFNDNFPTNSMSEKVGRHI